MGFGFRAGNAMEGYSSLEIYEKPNGPALAPDHVKPLDELRELVATTHFTTSQQKSREVADRVASIAEQLVAGQLSPPGLEIILKDLKSGILSSQIEWRNRLLRPRYLYLGGALLITALLWQASSLLTALDDGGGTAYIQIGPLFQRVLNFLIDYSSGASGLFFGALVSLAIKSARMSEDDIEYLKWYGLPATMYLILLILVFAALHYLAQSGIVDMQLANGAASLKSLANSSFFGFGLLVGLFEKPLADLLRRIIPT